MKSPLIIKPAHLTNYQRVTNLIANLVGFMEDPLWFLSNHVACWEIHQVDDVPMK